MNVIECLEWRYATKKFDASRSIPSSKINIIKEAFNLTATSYGLQPVKLVVLQNKELQKSLVAHSWNQEQVADASHVLVFCVEKEISENYIVNYFNRVKTIRNTPDDILNPFKEYLVDDFANKDAESIFQWAKGQAYLTMGNLLTVCALEEIDACPMEGFTPEKYDELLKLNEKGLRSVLVMPIGYRAEDDMFSDFKKVRKEVSESIVEIF
jgi:nitroreductase